MYLGSSEQKLNSQYVIDNILKLNPTHICTNGLKKMKSAHVKSIAKEDDSGFPYAFQRRLRRDYSHRLLSGLSMLYARLFKTYFYVL